MDLNVGLNEEAFLTYLGDSDCLFCCCSRLELCPSRTSGYWQSKFLNNGDNYFCIRAVSDRQQLVEVRTNKTELYHTYVQFRIRITSQDQPWARDLFPSTERVRYRSVSSLPTKSLVNVEINGNGWKVGIIKIK